MLVLQAVWSAETHKIDGVDCVMKTQSNKKVGPSYIGIDYHKRYSVYCVVDGEGEVQERGRIEHIDPAAFGALLRRWQGCRVVWGGPVF